MGFSIEGEEEWVRGGLKVPCGEGENENKLGGN